MCFLSTPDLEAGLSGTCRTKFQGDDDILIYWSIQLNQLELPDNDPATRSLFFSVHGLRRCNSPEGREVSGPEQVKQPHLPRFGGLSPMS